MSTNLAQAYVQILPTTKGIKGNLERELGGAGSAAGSKAGGLFSSTFKKYMGAAAIGTALMTGITSSILQGAELEQNLGGSKAVFGDWAETVQGYARDAYKNMGMSASEYLATANKMGSLFQGSGLSQARALDLTAQAMQRAADVASVMGIDTTMAMESIAGAAKGNFTMMDNLGVAMNATTLKAYALEKGINFDWNTADNAQKAELAMKMFLDRTKQYAGNYYNESVDTISGSFEAMKASAMNILGNMSLGENVVPYLKDLLTTTKTFLVGNLIPAIINIVKSIPTMVGSLMKGNFVGKLMKNLNVLSGKLLEGSTAFIDAGLGLMMKLADGIARGLPAIIRNLPVIVSNIADIINNNAPKLILTGLNIIKTLAIGIVKSIPVLIQNVPQILSALWKAFMAFNWVNLGRSIVVGLKSSLMGPVQKGLAGVVQTIKAKAAAIVNAFKAPFVEAFSAVKTAVARIKGIFPLKVGKIFSNLKLPKIAVSGGKAPFGIGGKGKLPNFKVNWNAEGGIFTKPTIIGNQGFGEAGAEVAMPLTKFWAKMDAMAEAISSMAGSGVLHMVINFDGTPIYEGAVNYINGQTLMFGASPVKV